MAKRPAVNIVFKQKASTLVERSGESAVVLLLSQYGAESSTEVTKIFYKGIELLSDISEEELNGVTQNPAEAYRAIKYCMGNAPAKVILSNLGWKDTWKRLVEEGKTNCIVTGIDDGAGRDTIISNIISLNRNKGYGCMAVFTGIGSDANIIPTHRSTHYGEVYSAIHYIGVDGDELSSECIRGLYAGAIAVCGVNRSLTNYTLPGIAMVSYDSENVMGIDKLVENGFIVAEMSAGKPRVVAGINTAEVGGDVTEDMQYIEVVQTMDMICKDLTDTFCEYYRGKSKNNYQRQLLFISAINGYFDDLAADEILDPEFGNHCEIDANAQRNAWIDKGYSEAESWSESVVKQRSFGRKVFLHGNVKACQCMSDFDMYIILE